MQSTVSMARYRQRRVLMQQAREFRATGNGEEPPPTVGKNDSGVRLGTINHEAQLPILRFGDRIRIWANAHVRRETAGHFSLGDNARQHPVILVEPIGHLARMVAREWSNPAGIPDFGS